MKVENKSFHDWLRMPVLELREACCLLYGVNPSKPSISKKGLRLSASEALNSSDWDNNEPGTSTRFAFYELVRRAILSGEFQDSLKKKS